MTQNTLNDLARRYHAFETVDADEFQRRARVLQSMWREEQGYEAAMYRGKIRGNRLKMPFAQESLANYLDDVIRLSPRHRALMEAMDCFVDGAVEATAAPALEQILRDHLLAGAMLEADEFDDGFFVFLSPDDNQFCRRAVARYRALLSDADTFQPWSLEAVVDATAEYTEAGWIDSFYERYLDFGRVDETGGF